MTADAAIALNREDLSLAVAPLEVRANPRVRLRRVGPKVGPPRASPEATESAAALVAWLVRRGAFPTALFATIDHAVLPATEPMQCRVAAASFSRCHKHRHVGLSPIYLRDISADQGLRSRTHRACPHL